MPTTFILGKKGGGKSLRAMRMMIDELRKTNRTIVTNYPLKYERMREYLVEKYGRDFDFKKRVVMLTTQETAHFWLYYGLASEPFFTPVEELSEGDKKRYPEGKWTTPARKIEGRVEQFEANDQKKTKVTSPNFAEREGWPAVAYFISEVHLTFNSRQWTRTGEDCLYYISLERHFGDDQFFDTQCFGNVDKQMRDMGQEYLMCTNQKKMPMPGTFGLVRRPGSFTCAHYSEPPTSKSVEALKSYYFPLDAEGVASCYRTIAGEQFGVGDDQADKKIEQKGKIPFSVMVLVGMLAFAATIYGLGKSANWIIGRTAQAKGDARLPGSGATNRVMIVKNESEIGRTSEVAKTQAAEDPPGKAGIAAREGVNRKRKADSYFPDDDREDAKAQVYMTGLAPGVGGKLMVLLSDGRTVSVTDRKFGGLILDGLGQAAGAIIDGVEYRHAPPMSRSERARL